jgi:hypothetical protein
MPDTKTAEQARTTILRALPGPKGDEWATAQAVATAADKGYSTVTETLRAMAIAGQAESRKLGRNTVWRRLVTPPKLRRDDVLVPRAKTVTVAEAKTAGKAAPRKVGTGRVRSHTGETRGGQADDGDVVWMAICRRGLEFHDLTSLGQPGGEQTLCARSTASATSWYGTREAAVSAGGQPCPRCVAVATAGSPVEVSEPVAVPQPPPAANTPTGGDAGAVMAFMESVRPVSAAPAEPEKPHRTRREPKAGKAPLAVWRRGELQNAILAHMRGLPEGESATPYAVAVALNSGPGAVAYSLDRLRVRGEVVKTSDQPQRYGAA